MSKLGGGWWALVAIVGSIVGCGSDDSSPTAAQQTSPAATSTTADGNATSASTTSSSTAPPTATMQPTTTPTVAPSTASPAPPDTSVPAGTVLSIADQFGLFEGLLGAAGMDQDIPYDVEYATLSPGPVQLQAFQSGDVDLGVVSPLGLIQAASGAVDLHAVARWRTDFALFALVTAPGVEGILGWDDIVGKRLAFQRNTMGEALVMLALDRLGLSLDDVTVVDIPHSQVTTVLQTGDADVGVTGEPFISAYLADNPTAAYVLGLEEPMAQSTIIVASDDALADPALSAAIAEYLGRLDRAFTQLTSDRTKFADLVVAVWNLDRTYVERVLQGSDGVRMDSVPGDLLDPYQRLIDLLVARNDVPDDVDPTQLFDQRFNGLFQT